VIRMTVSAITFGVALATAASATCPYTECDYTDPQYKAAFQRWNDCVTPYTDHVTHTLETLALLYPRFGIAFRAYSDELTRANTQPGDNQAAVDEARRRFDDRILHTAEPEVLRDYNMLMLSAKQHPVEAQCGLMPEPPRKVP
jgi:hypothetical protein